MASRSRWIKPGLIALAGLVLLLAVAGWLLNRALQPQQLAALIAAQVTQATGRDFRIGGSLSLSLLPRLAVVAEDLSFGNAAWGSRPEMLHVAKARLAFGLLPLLQRRIEIDRVALQGVDLLLETDRNGVGNWVLRPPAAAGAASAPEGQALQVAVEQIELDDVKLGWRDGRSGSRRELQLPRATLEPRGAQTQLDVQLALDGQAWRVQGSTGRIAAFQANAAEWPFDLRATGSGMTLAAKGGVLAGPSPRAVKAEVLLEIERGRTPPPDWLPGAVPLPLRAQATLDFRNDTLRVDALQATLAGQTLNGRFGLVLGATPKLDAQLKAGTLDLSRWWPAGSAAKAEPPAPGSGRRWIFPDTPLPLQGLPRVTASIALRIDKLLAPKLPPLAALNVRIGLSDGRLQVDPLNFGVAGGQVQAGLTLVPAAGGVLRATARAQADNLSVDDLMRAAGTPGYARGGTLRLTSRLEGGGTTWRTLAAGVSGDVLLSASGVTIGTGLSPLGTDLLPQLLGVLARNKAARTDSTLLNCAVVRLPFRAGTATVDRSIAIETPQFVASARGEVRLTDEALTLAVRPASAQGPDLNPLNLASLVVIKGPILDPKLSLDPAGVAGMAAAIGAAGATGGLSLLAERLLQGGPSDPHPCRFALTGQAGAAAAPAPAPAPAPTQTPTPNKPGPGSQPSLPNVLRGLFGR